MQRRNEWPVCQVACTRKDAKGAAERRQRHLLVIVTMLLALCGSSSASRVVTDETGRRVEVSDHPHRIVCLVPSITDEVFALGADADVVAISNYTKYPARALTKPSIGDPTQPSMEVLLSLHPDLVLGIQTSNPMQALGQIERLGIPVYLIDPHGLNGLLHSLKSLGEVLGREGDAAALVNSLQHRITAVRARTEALPRPSVFMPIWYDPIITIGRGSFISEIITAAGGRSITDDLMSEWPQISLEAVVARGPQALLLIRGGNMALDTLRERPGWAALQAVRHDRVFYVDDRIELVSPVAIDALEELSFEFHP